MSKSGGRPNSISISGCENKKEECKAMLIELARAYDPSFHHRDIVKVSKYFKEYVHNPKKSYTTFVKNGISNTTLSNNFNTDKINSVLLLPLIDFVVEASFKKADIDKAENIEVVYKNLKKLFDYLDKESLKDMLDKANNQESKYTRYRTIIEDINAKLLDALNGNYLSLTSDFELVFKAKGEPKLENQKSELKSAEAKASATPKTPQNDLVEPSKKITELEKEEYKEENKSNKNLNTTQKSNVNMGAIQLNYKYISYALFFCIVVILCFWFGMRTSQNKVISTTTKESQKDSRNKTSINTHTIKGNNNTIIGGDQIKIDHVESINIQ